MFENILDKHIDQKGIKIDIKIIKQVKTILSHITDQTIIASSQTIENASISPRLRIMSEVTTNGNPHSGSYNNITNKSFNLILQKNDGVKKLEKELLIKIPEIKILSMTHKNNGEYIVFQFQIE